MSKDIKIKPIYNSIVFQVKRTPGDARRTFASHGVYERTIPEGYYMNRKAPKKTNPVINFFKRMYTEMKGIIDAIKPDDVQPVEDIKNVRGTTIEI